MSRLSSTFLRMKSWTWQDFVALLLVLLAAGMFISQVATVRDASIDDAFLTFTFSKNLALGHGPVYSHGVRVEGYSNFLWMVIVALPLVFTRGAALLLCARIMGAFFVVLLGWSGYRLARACGASRITAALGLVLLSFSTDLAVAYLTGLETLPYAAVVCLLFACATGTFHDRRYHRWAGWAGLAVALMRIDGFIPFGFWLGWVFLGILHRRDICGLRWFVRTYGPPVAAYVVWFLGRWAYYGMILPSTYYAKSRIAELIPNRGFEYVTGELRNGWLWIAFIGWMWLLWRRRAGAALAGTFALLHLVYVMSVGGDWMPFARFILPIVPIACVLVVLSVADVISAALRTRSLFRWLAPVAPVPLVFMLAVRADHRYLNDGHERFKVAGSREATEHVASYIKAAEFLRAVVPAGGRLVTDYGGVFACYTDGSLIEMWGLANAMIATEGDTEGVQPIYGKTCARCYPALNPEYFHVMEPMVRREPAFSSVDNVIANVWQTDTIGRYIDFKATFVVGRVHKPKTGESLYFLKKHDKGYPPAGELPDQGLVVDYPFGTQPENAKTDATASGG